MILTALPLAGVTLHHMRTIDQYRAAPTKPKRRQHSTSYAICTHFMSLMARILDDKGCITFAGELVQLTDLNSDLRHMQFKMSCRPQCPLQAHHTQHNPLRIATAQDMRSGTSPRQTHEATPSARVPCASARCSPGDSPMAARMGPIQKRLPVPMMLPSSCAAMPPASRKTLPYPRRPHSRHAHALPLRRTSLQKSASGMGPRVPGSSPMAARMGSIEKRPPVPAMLPSSSGAAMTPGNSCTAKSTRAAIRPALRMLRHACRTQYIVM